MTSSMEILMRAHVHVVMRTGTWIVCMLDNGRKLMCIEFGQFIMNGYADIHMHTKSGLM